MRVFPTLGFVWVAVLAAMLFALSPVPAYAEDGGDAKPGAERGAGEGAPEAEPAPPEDAETPSNDDRADDAEADEETSPGETVVAPAPAGEKDGKGRRLGKLGERMRQDGDADMAGMIGFFGLLVLGGLSLFALQILLLVTMPAAVERVQAAVETKRLFSFVLGLVNTIFFLLLSGVLAHAGPGGGLLSAVFFFAFLFLVLFGLSGKALQIGGRTGALAGFGPNPLLNLTLGWWTIFFVSLIPFVGWVLALYWGISGVGAVILGTIGDRGGSKGSEAPQPQDDFQSPTVKV
jgi:hypothetical protein